MKMGQLLMGLAVCLLVHSAAAGALIPSQSGAGTGAGPIAVCVAGPAHPADCTSGTHDAPFGTHDITHAGFQGFIVSKIQWGAGPGEALYRSCDVRHLGLVPTEVHCIDQGAPPPDGAAWTHRCTTFPGSIGAAACTATAQRIV